MPTRERAAAAKAIALVLSRDDENPICGRCKTCHPGRQWGGDEKCTIADCTCHRYRRIR